MRRIQVAQPLLAVWFYTAPERHWRGYDLRNPHSQEWLRYKNRKVQ